MTLSQKLIAEYTELINQELDNIPVESLEDFLSIQLALDNILHPQDNLMLPEKFQERLIYIQAFIQQPELYIQHAENFEAFQEIIQHRIQAKILEFQSYNEAQKYNYMRQLPRPEGRGLL